MTPAATPPHLQPLDDALAAVEQLLAACPRRRAVRRRPARFVAHINRAGKTLLWAIAGARQVLTTADTERRAA